MTKMGRTNPLSTATSSFFHPILKSFSHISFPPTTFNDSIATAYARVSALRIRISRWGICAGILTPPATSKYLDLPSQAHTNLSPEKIAVAEDLLTTLLSDIQQAQAQSYAYRQQQGPQQIGHAPAPLPSDLPSRYVRLVSRSSQIVDTRAGKSQEINKIGGRSEWVFHDRSSFDFIMGWAAETLDALERLTVTPGGKIGELGEQLCRWEVEGLGDAEVLGVLREAVVVEVDGYRDERLLDAVEDVFGDKV